MNKKYLPGFSFRNMTEFNNNEVLLAKTWKVFTNKANYKPIVVTSKEFATERSIFITIFQ